MILTTYACVTLATNEDGTSSHFWIINEGLHLGEKKVVIHEVKDSIVGWASIFDDVAQAQMYWSFLVAAKFDPTKARELYKESLHA